MPIAPCMKTERTAKRSLRRRPHGAKASKKQNKAMSGAGGRFAVKLPHRRCTGWQADLGVPAATGTNIQKLDVTQLSGL